MGVRPLHSLCGAWGGIAADIFGLQALGGLGGVSFSAQLIGTLTGIVFARVGGFVIYASIAKILGLRLSRKQEFHGTDLSIHKIGSINPD